MEPTDPYSVGEIEEPQIEWDDDAQSILLTVRQWGDKKLLEEEHIEDEREYFKRKLIGS